MLGIDLPRDRVLRILSDLGVHAKDASAESALLVSPSWRRDLTREIDLIEEVARIHGYDSIPENVGVPLAPSARRAEHRVLSSVRQALTAGGFSEALTASVVDERQSSSFSPWTDAQPLRCNTPLLRGADCLRRSLVPSLLEARRINESLANETIELFETARVYLLKPEGLPEEPLMLALTSGREFREVKGVIEAILQRLHVTQPLSTQPIATPLLDDRESCQLVLGTEPLGLLGNVSQAGLRQWSLRQPTVVAELSMDLLARAAELIPQFHSLSNFPAIDYDYNFVVKESVRWGDLSDTVTRAAGPVLERIEYRETYRDEQHDGPGRKRLLLSVRLRSADQTLTGEQAEMIRQAIISACQQEHAARLL